MDDFLKKIIEGAVSISPPQMCEQSFQTNFSEAMNVEWSKRGEEYEVVFYKNNLEHIASFLASGELNEYRMILPNGLLPETVKARLEECGEIMNQVLVNKGNTIQYEAIVRDKKLNRYLVEVTDLGQVVTERLL